MGRVDGLSAAPDVEEGGLGGGRGPAEDVARRGDDGRAETAWVEDVGDAGAAGFFEGRECEGADVAVAEEADEGVAAVLEACDGSGHAHVVVECFGGPFGGGGFEDVDSRVA